MPQVFHKSINSISRVSIVAVLALFVSLGAGMYVLGRSSFATNVGVIREQPIPFSHEHHVNALGIDCRYCHNSVETNAYAGMPSTKTCMNCHQQIWVGSEMLEPVRESYRTNKPIEWTRVNRLADFVYFDHSVHVNKGVSCVSCHGPVNQMPLMYQHGTLLMEWCLDCHRKPEQHLRPKEHVFDMDWTPARIGETQQSLGTRLLVENRVEKLLHCSTCHR